jgi:hypothetical protein
MRTRDLIVGKGETELKADKFTATSDQTVQKMCESRRLNGHNLSNRWLQTTFQLHALDLTAT